MRLFPVGKVYDFMGKRVLFAGVSVLLALLSLVLIFVKGPKLGTDFKGGTEIEVQFSGPTDGGQVRAAVETGGFSSPDVIKVDDLGKPGDRYLIRVQEVSTIGEEKKAQIGRALCHGEKLPQDRCPESRQATEVKFSPGGDKISVRFREAPDLEWVRQQMAAVSGVELRAGANNPVLQNARDHKVDIQLKSKGDQLMDALRQRLGPKVPETPLRVEWIGPKAGAQLRDAALRAIAISVVFIMMYIAFRFDLRFAPGAVFALVHDTITTVGVLIILDRELNLTTVAALLTIVGYSVNDTVVVFDRVRENLGRLRGATFPEIINVSLSEMLDRTILTGGTGCISLLCFFIWGTGTLKDFALTLVLGVILGTYSSIYVALPFTEWFDRRFFSKMSLRKPAAPVVRRKSIEAGAV
jgi:preprotein translocase subunit SecF